MREEERKILFCMHGCIAPNFVVSNGSRVKNSITRLLLFLQLFRGGFMAALFFSPFTSKVPLFSLCLSSFPFGDGFCFFVLSLSLYIVVIPFVPRLVAYTR
jgi:hypothetical protein